MKTKKEKTHTHTQLRLVNDAFCTEEYDRCADPESLLTTLTVFFLFVFFFHFFFFIGSTNNVFFPSPFFFLYFFFFFSSLSVMKIDTAMRETTTICKKGKQNMQSEW